MAGDDKVAGGNQVQGSVRNKAAAGLADKHASGSRGQGQSQFAIVAVGIVQDQAVLGGNADRPADGIDQFHSRGKLAHAVHLEDLDSVILQREYAADLVSRHLQAGYR